MLFLLMPIHVVTEHSGEGPVSWSGEISSAEESIKEWRKFGQTNESSI